MLELWGFYDLSIDVLWLWRQMSKVLCSYVSCMVADCGYKHLFQYDPIGSTPCGVCDVLFLVVWYITRQDKHTCTYHMDYILLGHTLNGHHCTKFSIWGYLSPGVCTPWTTEGNHEQRYRKLLLFVFVGGGRKSRDLRFTPLEYIYRDTHTHTHTRNVQSTITNIT